jgi:predicted MPP superfamily phosphohydrolase
MRTFLFVLPIVLILGLACTYMSMRTLAFSPFLQKFHYSLTWGIFAFLLLSVFLIPVLARHAGLGMAALAWVSYIAFGIISTYIIYLALADLFQYIACRFMGAPHSIKEWVLCAAVSATLVSNIAGLVQALLPPTIRRVEVPILGLAKALEGFTIVQISDLHINSMLSKRSIQKLVHQVNSIEPNLIAITGDLVDGPVSDLLPKVEILGGLTPKNCVCFVAGNHEYYTGDLQNWMAVFNQMNWCVLMNDNVFIQRNDAKLAVLGIPESTSRGSRGIGPKPNLTRALADIPQGTPKILLNHKPTDLFDADRAGIALQLSGHTHGGQYFPWSAIVPLFFDFPAGLKRYKRMWIYTSVGTGFWGPPNRFLRSKELTVLVLKKT